MTIPAGMPRRLVNLSSNRPALIHDSLAASAPGQTWVNGRFAPVEQPVGSTGRTGAERLCRNNPADRFELAPRALFQDLFSGELGAQGICGGYGAFEPGARLPCHRHEFDESITIVPEQPLAWSKEGATSFRVIRPHSCRRGSAITSST